MIVDPHPLLDLATLEVRWPAALGALSVPPWLDALPAAPTALPPLPEGHAERVRALLRHGGFKPAGRNKPCSEYIRNARAEGRFPRIDPVVDLTNLAVLHGGLPVSTVDLDRTVPPLRVGVADPGTSYVFNASGQVIDVGGLLCLHDADGACANAVKDAQRTKTTAATVRTLTLVWGTVELPGRAEEVVAWLREASVRLGGTPA